MISQPGAAMLDSKLFVSRYDDPFPDLYERFWDGFEWIWVNHGRPEGKKMANDPGAMMMNEKLFVIVEDGAVWERHWRNDLGRWAWENHGRPNNVKVKYGPGAEMMNEKFFVVTEDGDLWERHWRSDLNRWAWENHGRPESKKIIAAPGAAMMNEKLFVAVEDGELWELNWRSDLGRWAWENHGRPGNEKIKYAPGAAMMNEKLFVTTENGNVWERHWRNDLGRWAWQSHGKPGGTDLCTAPGAEMMNSKFFVGASNGNLFERVWNGSEWVWVDHGRPGDTRVATAPGAAMMNSKLFVGTSNSHLFERVWTGTEWKWVDHGTAYHDQSAHVIGQPGTDPKMTVAILGDGFAEGDMNNYKDIVNNHVVDAFHKDTIGNHLDKFRVIRIDSVSPVSGVTTRDYDEHGTVPSGDDTLTSENFRFSRLGTISTGLWSHAWIERAADTPARIDHIAARFAPDATFFIVVVNDGREGGVRTGRYAFFTRGESSNVIAHEMGHLLFNLGDEYNNDTQNWTFGDPGVVNLSNTTDRATLKWASFVSASTPLPTDPAHLPSGWNNETSVGGFSGGGGNFSTGIFHPVLRCRMNQNNPPWCPVCAAEINRILNLI